MARKREQESQDAPAEEMPINPASFPPLAEGDGGTGLPQSLELVLDVDLQISVELGRAMMALREVLELGPGSVVELDKLAGEPVDVLINQRVVAKGEVVVIEDMFGVRITEILANGVRERPWSS